MGSINDAEVQAAISKITKTCQDAGMPLGIFAGSAESAKPYLQRGFTLVAISTDCLHMAQGAGAALNEVKNFRNKP